MKLFLCLVLISCASQAFANDPPLPPGAPRPVAIDDELVLLYLTEALAEINVAEEPDYV